MLIKFIIGLFAKKFAKNVMIIAGGRLGGQLITFSLTPLITRIYSPTEFGIMGGFLAISAIVIPCAALTYPLAIGIQKKDGDAKNIAKLSLYLSLGLSVTLTILIFFFGELIVNSLNIIELSSYLILIPLMVFFSSWLEIIQQWSIRNKKFKEISRTTIIQSISINLAKVGFGLLWPKAFVLVYISVIGTALHSILLYCGVRNTSPLTSTAIEKRKSSSPVALLKKFSDFPIYRAPQVLINSVSHGLPVLMLASIFGPITAGFYSLSAFFMAAPATLVGKSVGDVFYPRVNEAHHNNENLAKLIIEATAVLAVASFIPFVTVIFYGPAIFSIIFGGDWESAGVFARWLSVLYFFNLINKPSVASVPVLGLQKGLLVYEVMSSSAKVLGLLIGFYFFNDAVVAIMLFSIVGAVAYVFMISWIIFNSLKRGLGEEAS